MQYILTQEEIEKLRPGSEVTLRDEALAAIRPLLLKEANYTCIHEKVKTSRGGSSYGGYCDDCPVVKLEDYTHQKLLCTLPREFSK